MERPNRIDPLALAQALIRCPSVTPHDAGALDALQVALERIGFLCERLTFSEPPHADVDNLYARIGTGRPHFCFAGHTDVVPPGDAGAWSVDPFGGAIVDGRLYGRGAADMKGALAAFVAAAARFLEHRGAGFGGCLSLLITGDEEGDAVNGTAKVLDWLDREGTAIDACLVGEPTSPAALGDVIKIGRRGSLNGWLTVYGTQGHVAYPARADNAVHHLVRMLAALTAAPLDALTGAGESVHFQPSNLEVTTVDVGNHAVNVIPDQARAAFNIRFNDRHTAAGLSDWLHRTLAAAGGRHELALRASGESFLTPPGPFTELVAGAAARVLGRRPACDTGGGTSDARFIRAYAPVVEFGLVNETIHKIDEYAPVDDILRLTDVYAAVLDDFFAT